MTPARLRHLTRGLFLMSRLGQASGSVASGSCFLLLGAGFGTVMVTATAVVVRQASTHTAGVAGGLQQTAMNIGPTLGVAAVTMLMTAFAARGPGGGAGPGGGPYGNGPYGDDHAFISTMGPTLTALAGVAAIGMALALRLPGRARTAAVSNTDEAPSPAPAGQPTP